MNDEFVCYDRSGTLQAGIFYHLEVGDFTVRNAAITDEWIVNSDLIDDVRCELFDLEYRRQPLECGHELSSIQSARYELPSGPAEYGAYTNSEQLICIDEKTNRLLQFAHFKNFKSVELSSRANETDRVYAISSTSKKLSRVSYSTGQDVTCPNCNALMLCHECGHLDRQCVNCSVGKIKYFSTVADAENAVLEEGRIPTVFRYQNPVVDVGLWDGEDFFYVGGARLVVSKRVLRFLLEHHFGPIFCEPVFARVDGVSKNKRQMLKVARGD